MNSPASPAASLNFSTRDRIRLAAVGIGNRGAEVIRELHATGLAEVVALCDTDLGAKPTQAILGEFPQAATFRDFRRMFDRMANDIDAVCVSTPDFSHFPVVMQAMALGKSVYVEKPMAHTFRQIELMMAAERRYGVACQMGNQGRSGAGYFQFKAWVDAGIIRNVTRITAFMNYPRRWHGMTVSGLLPAQPMPDGLDWEAWLATAADHAYHPGYVNGDWRSWYDFGNGALGDWGAHIIDHAHEFLALGLPVEVDPVRIDGHSPFIFPQATTLRFHFPARGAQPPVELTWYDGQDNLPPLPADFGEPVRDPKIPLPSAGSLSGPVQPPGKVIYGEEFTFQGGSHATTLKIIPESKARDVAARLPEVPAGGSDHYQNFLRAVRGEETCRANFAVSGPLCQALALGIVAQRLNARLQFDPVTKRVTNHPAANDLLAGPPPRPGWEPFYRL
ncbi:MAG TPA: Gfo/Idh/MocA family oxidoreductase [Opitutaceae bacterium]